MFGSVTLHVLVVTLPESTSPPPRDVAVPPPDPPPPLNVKDDDAPVTEPSGERPNPDGLGLEQAAATPHATASFQATRPTTTSSSARPLARGRSHDRTG